MRRETGGAETSTSVDTITDVLSELPIGLIIFIIALLFGMFGRDDKKQVEAPAPRREMVPDEPAAPSIFASDDRRAREERAMREQVTPEEAMTFGGFDFGSSDALFHDDERDSQWGKTKYGFDASEWGSAFPDKKSSEPTIH